MSWVSITVIFLILGKCAAQWGLERLNQRHARDHAGAVPEALQGVMSPAAYAKSTAYTLAKSWLRQRENLYYTLCLLVVLFSGLLPWAFRTVTGAVGTSVWAVAAYLFVIGMILTLAGLPFDCHHQFGLEARFGFNTSTRKTRCLDQLEGWLLALGLGYPLAALILALAARAGSCWWLWASGLTQLTRLDLGLNRRRLSRLTRPRFPNRWADFTA